MNIYKQRLLNVARALRESPAPAKFDMSDVINDCGTPGCAFGHYVWRTDLQNRFKPIQEEGWWHPVSVDSGMHVMYFGEEVRDHFGLTDEEQSEIFEADGCEGAKTALEAAVFIEGFADRKWPNEGSAQL